jgi:copper chaperone
MIEFTVNDMTCGHCAQAITKAVAAVDQNASVKVEVAERRVSIASSAERSTLEAAIRDAGYTPA